MHNRLLQQLTTYLGLAAMAVLTSACATIEPKVANDAAKVASAAPVSNALDYMKRTPDEERYRLVLSIPDQRMALLDGEKVVQEYAISTALKGVSEALNSDGTPRGLHVIAEKIGDGQPVGMIFKGREPTGVISELNPTEGIPPVVTRLFRLRGLETSNQTTYDRLIYLHGSPHEALLGRPASGGCIRMSSADVIALFNTVEIGTPITISETPLLEAIANALETERRFVRLRQRATGALVSAGDAASIHLLCYGHSYGVSDVPLNFRAARLWCQYGADRGVPSSITLLAEHNELGLSGPPDPQTARMLYEKAAALDHPFALSKAAEMQKRGVGGAIDLVAAALNTNRLRGLRRSDAAKTRSRNEKKSETTSQ